MTTEIKTQYGNSSMQYVGNVSAKQRSPFFLDSEIRVPLIEKEISGPYDRFEKGSKTMKFVKISTRNSNDDTATGQVM